MLGWWHTLIVSVTIMQVHNYSYLFFLVKVQNSNITMWHEMKCIHTGVRAHTLSTFFSKSEKNRIES